MAQQQIKNCKQCGRVFIDMGRGICRDCFEKEEEQVMMILSYVRDNPNSRVRDICEALNVKERLVMRMIREGRFVTEGFTFEYPCERCGASITIGKLCDACTAKLQDEMSKHMTKVNAALAKKRAAQAVNHMKSMEMGLPRK